VKLIAPGEIFLKVDLYIPYLIYVLQIGDYVQGKNKSDGKLGSATLFDKNIAHMQLSFKSLLKITIGSENLFKPQAFVSFNFSITCCRWLEGTPVIERKGVPRL